MHVLVVEDDFAARAGMVMTLHDALPDATVHEADSIAVSIDALKRRRIDLVLLDLMLRDSSGIATLRAMQSHCAGLDEPPRLIVVSAAAAYDSTDGDVLHQAIEECATGFFVKGMSQAEFRDAIACALAGRIYIPAQYQPRRQSTGPLKIRLTERERQIGELLGSAMRYKEVARAMTRAGHPMSDHTVRVHVQRIAWKLGVADAGFAQLPAKTAVLMAFTAGLLQGSAHNP